MRGRSQRRGNIHSCALSEFCLNLQNGRYTKEESQGKSGRLGWGGSMLKILVIDDSVLMRRVVRDHLEKEGFAVEEFLPASVLELMERVKTSPPDLVLSDFNMPYVDGLEVARNVRRVNPNIPVIILTANRDCGPRSQAADRGRPEGAVQAHQRGNAGRCGTPHPGRFRNCIKLIIYM